MPRKPTKQEIKSLKQRRYDEHGAYFKCTNTDSCKQYDKDETAHIAKPWAKTNWGKRKCKCLRSNSKQGYWVCVSFSSAW